jgi:hypothetical protein
MTTHERRLLLVLAHVAAERLRLGSCAQLEAFSKPAMLVVHLYVLRTVSGVLAVDATASGASPAPWLVEFFQRNGIGSLPFSLLGTFGIFEPAQVCSCELQKFLMIDTIIAFDPILLSSRVVGKSAGSMLAVYFCRHLRGRTSRRVKEFQPFDAFVMLFPELLTSSDRKPTASSSRCLRACPPGSFCT